MKKKIVIAIMLLAAMTCIGCDASKTDKKDESTSASQEKDNTKDDEKKEDGKDKKASKALGEYQKFVRIYDKEKGYVGGYESTEKNKTLKFDYDVDLDDKKDNIVIKDLREVDGLNDEYSLNINGSEVKFETGTILRKVWGVTLDGESMYIALCTDEGHVEMAHLFQYKDGKVVDQGKFGIVNLSDTGYPDTDPKYVDSIKVDEDGTINGMIRDYTIQCSNYEAKYKANDTGKIEEVKSDSKERIYLEKNKITLKKEIKIYEKAKGKKTKVMKPQKFTLVKGIADKDKSKDVEYGWYFVKGEKGDEGWINKADITKKEGELYEYFDGLVMYD